MTRDVPFTLLDAKVSISEIGETGEEIKVWDIEGMKWYAGVEISTRHTRHGELNFRLASVNLKSLASLASVKFTIKNIILKICLKFVSKFD